MVKGLEALASMAYPGRVIIIGRDPADVADAMYRAMNPITPERDYRVGVAVAFQNLERELVDIAIINRHDLS